jgi:malate dehydrogenase (oxaloacetate-decarboxylating)
MGTPTTTSRSRPAMTATSPGYSTTLRVVAPTGHGATADLAGAISAAGGSVTALDVVESSADLLVVDVTGNAADADHVDRIAGAVEALEGVRVRKVSDRTFLLHLGGNLEVVPTVPLKHRDDLTRAYTPGVARVCRAIAEHPEDARRLTIKRNTVAVVTDGSAVLGLGNIGPAASMPVMEGKAALFKRFGGVDAWPVALHRTGVRRHQPGGHLGAAVLRDRAPAPRPVGHTGLPRRPARHRDRRARSPDQRAASGG